MPVIIYVCNAYESFAGFIEALAIDTQALERQLLYFGDRALFYAGTRTLVITSVPIQHAEYVRSLGLRATPLTPTHPSRSICHDLIHDESLVQQVLAALGTATTIQMIPYCSTPEFYQMVAAWRSRFGLSIETPESPEPSLSWLREALDRKSVFATLAPFLLEGTCCLMPPRVLCTTRSQAAAAVMTYLNQGQSCVVKPDNGYLGLGLARFSHNQPWTLAQVQECLADNQYLPGDRLAVEVWIAAGDACISPSVEAFVPRYGDPTVTYICDQVFSESKLFSGILISQHLDKSAWAHQLQKAALAVAAKLQTLGYCGYFDLDAIVAADGQVYIIEMNPRRTGGTHVHEMAQSLLGDAYRDRYVLLSGTLHLNQSYTWPDLSNWLSSHALLYAQQAEGIVPVQVSSLVDGFFAYVIIAATEARLQVLQAKLMTINTAA